MPIAACPPQPASTGAVHSAAHLLQLRVAGVADECALDNAQSVPQMPRGSLASHPAKHQAGVPVGGCERCCIGGPGFAHPSTCIQAFQPRSSGPSAVHTPNCVLPDVGLRKPAPPENPPASLTDLLSQLSMRHLRACWGQAGSCSGTWPAQQNVQALVVLN